MNHSKTISKLLEEFKALDLYPIIGAELEFYLTSDSGHVEELAIDIAIEKEKGKNQFEVKTAYSGDILNQIEKIENLKETIIKQAKAQNMIANFSAKPFLDQPGSALHVHLHLENRAKENLFMNQDILSYAIGGLCATMQENMLIFAPYEQAYLRYTGNSLDSPCKICWGFNNRSAAIRIPLSEKENVRLEHRVACSDASVEQVICAIFSGVLQGIKEKIEPPEKLYGNAFLEQYNYEQLAQNIKEAQLRSSTTVP